MTLAARLVRDVTATEVPAAERPTPAHPLQLYLHDFSEYAPLESPYGEVGEEGLFPCAWLESYWQEAGRVALLIRADGRIAGFVLLNRWSALDRPLDRAVAEFFVLRKYRRARVGTRVAHIVFRRYPGRWEVPVAEYNRPALAFWRSAVGSLGVGRIEEQPGNGQRWSGTVLSFDNRPASAERQQLEERR